VDSSGCGATVPDAGRVNWNRGYLADSRVNEPRTSETLRGFELVGGNPIGGLRKFCGTTHQYMAVRKRVYRTSENLAFPSFETLMGTMPSSLVTSSQNRRNV
jgi:hypothetical protein